MALVYIDLFVLSFVVYIAGPNSCSVASTFELCKDLALPCDFCIKWMCDCSAGSL